MFLAALFTLDKKLKTTQMSFSRWVVKQNAAYPYHRLSSEKEQPSHMYQLGEFGETHTEWTKPISENCILFESIYMTFLKWWNHRDGEPVSGCEELWSVRRRTGHEMTAWRILVMTAMFLTLVLATQTFLCDTIPIS
jgi:hypothetical protein